jgi:peroxiredoxin family protein
MEVKRMDVEEMAKKASLKDLKEIAKKNNIKLGRCPTKIKIAKLIPKDELEALVGESE